MSLYFNSFLEKKKKTKKKNEEIWEFIRVDFFRKFRVYVSIFIYFIISVFFVYLCISLCILIYDFLVFVFFNLYLSIYIFLFLDLSLFISKISIIFL